MKIESEEIQEILRKHQQKLSSQIKLDEFEAYPGDSFSQDYKVFRRETLEMDVAWYERLCAAAERLVHISPTAKDREKLNAAIEIAHLNITPEGAVALGILFSTSLVFFGLVLGALSYFLLGELSFSVYFWPLAILFTSALLLKPMSYYPVRIANKWRLQASNQMVLCILYVVMYMRHTSNLEHAIKFAGEHIGNPLALDLRKILWDAETGKYVTIKESLDNYLEGWRHHNLEFVESFHLIEGSLYEPNEDRRLHVLEKGLEIMLTGTYENMLHYAQDLKSPITMIYMMGVILPVLGLVVFPLMSGFLGGVVKWWHLGILYNIILPVFVYLYGKQYLEKRPTGYGGEDILRLHPEFEEFTKMNFFSIKMSPLPLAIFIGGILFLIGLLPLILFYASSGQYDAEPFGLGFKLLDYKEISTSNGVGFIGPYGMWSMLLSLFIPLGLAIGIGIYYYFWSKKLTQIRDNTRKLEKEFSGAIFQLGNRVGDGIPVESAFDKVAESMKGTPSGDFLRIIGVNIRKLGMSVKEAIFDKDRGGLTYFPSNLLKSSMKVLVESARKGPLVVSKSLITISDYISRVDAVAERLKDLLADVISSMKSQTSFLTPMIAGIVVGVTSMMINIINLLSISLSEAQIGGVDEAGVAGVGGLTGILDVLNITGIIPGYQFQIVVGIFVMQMAIILTILSNGIENGVDPVAAKNKVAKNLFISTGLYFVISLVSILIFSVLAAGIAGFGGGFG